MGKLSKAFEKSDPQKSHVPAFAPPIANSLQFSAETAASTAETADFDFFESDHWDQRLRLATDPHSPLFENLRRLRVRILDSSSGRKFRTLLVTSVMPHEGKGFVCANLGIAISQDLGHQAMILDCDFRRPAIAPLFGLTNESGLVDYLQDDIDLSLLIRKTGQPKLSLIPSGKPPRNPSELMSSGKMISLIHELANRYQDNILLFDSPPHSIASETSVLAKHLDGVILVVRYGISSREHVRKFINSIGREKIVGLVFNALPENKIERILAKKQMNAYHYYL